MFDTTRSRRRPDCHHPLASGVLAVSSRPVCSSGCSAIRAAGAFAAGFRAGDDFDFLLRRSRAPARSRSIATSPRGTGSIPARERPTSSLSGQGTVRALAQSLRRRRIGGTPRRIHWRVSLISVLMATFNGEAFVEEAITSVLGQDGIDLELVVTDDGSTDLTPSIVSDLARQDKRIRFAIQPHTGMAAARNNCLARSREATSRCSIRTTAAPRASLRANWLCSTPPRSSTPSSGYADVRVLGGLREPEYTMLLSAGLLRREAVEAVGEFDLRYTSADDFDFLLRMIEAGHRIALETELGIEHRRHRRQVSSDLAATRSESVRALARSLQRRRQRGIEGPLNHPLMTRMLR